MRKLKMCFGIGFLLITSLMNAQEERIELHSFVKDTSCEINFKPSTSIADLESFAKCFVYKSPEVAAQSTLKNNEINFRKLPLLPTNQQFPTVQNTYRTPVLFFGEYDNEFANARTNNLAFFEANRNSVLSAGNVIFPGVPIF